MSKEAKESKKRLKTNYRIKYRKGVFEVEVQGDKDWVESKFKELTEEKAVPTQIVPPEKSELASLSLVEFVKTKGNPNTHADLAMIFSYWLHNRENMDTYNIADIDACYSEARITPSKNTNDVMNNNQRKGYVKPASEEKDGKKAWVITLTGEEYVEEMK